MNICVVLPDDLFHQTAELSTVHIENPPGDASLLGGLVKFRLFTWSQQGNT